MNIGYMTFQAHLNNFQWGAFLEENVGGQQLIAILQVVKITGTPWQRAAPEQAFPGLRPHGAVTIGTGRQGGGGGGQAPGTTVKAFFENGTYRVKQIDAVTLCAKLRIPAPAPKFFS